MSQMTSTQSDLAAQQQVFGKLRIAVTILLLLLVASWGAIRFGGWNLTELSQHLLSDPLQTTLVVLFSPQTLRFVIAPLTAITLVFLYAGTYVKDIYALPQLRQGLRYVYSSVAAARYPRLNIDGGEKKLTEGKVNLLNAIGGPGYVYIHPGNAVLFRKLRQPSNVTLRETYFLAPFETIGQIASLDEQQGSRDGVHALSRDGIRVTVRNIHYRYRLCPEMEGGRPKQRTLENPYPFDEEALWNMAYTLSVNEDGLEPWKTAVGRAVIGGITNFINAHEIDYLTAPRQASQDPRNELNQSLLNGPTRAALRNLGAELIYVDLGHFAIDEEKVDEQRAETWAATWLGNAQVVRAYGEAKHSVYLELGRAEAQAELVMGIADALQNANLGEDSTETVRRLLLNRTAQLLEAMTETSKNVLEEKTDDQHS
jgi:hypothetical protein